MQVLDVERIIQHRSAAPKAPHVIPASSVPNPIPSNRPSGCIFNPNLELYRRALLAPHCPRVYLAHPLPEMQPSAGLLLTFGLSLSLVVNAGSHARSDAVSLQNGQDAIALKYA